MWQSISLAVSGNKETKNLAAIVVLLLGLIATYLGFFKPTLKIIQFQ